MVKKLMGIDLRLKDQALIGLGIGFVLASIYTFPEWFTDGGQMSLLGFVLNLIFFTFYIGFPFLFLPFFSRHADRFKLSENGSLIGGWLIGGGVQASITVAVTYLLFVADKPSAAWGVILFPVMGPVATMVGYLVGGLLFKPSTATKE